MADEKKRDDQTQKVSIRMLNPGIFKSNFDTDEMFFEGFCDNLFFRGKCYIKEIVDKVLKFNSQDGRFKFSEAEFILDGFEDNFGEKKMRLILKKAGDILPNPKKEKKV